MLPGSGYPFLSLGQPLADWLDRVRTGRGGQLPAVLAVRVVVPDVLFSGGRGDAEPVVGGSPGLLPELVGLLDAVPQPSGPHWVICQLCPVRELRASAREPSGA